MEFGFLVTIELDMSYGSAGEGRREESLQENVVALYIVIYDMHEPAWFYLAWCCMSHHIVSSNDITVYAQHIMVYFRV